MLSVLLETDNVLYLIIKDPDDAPLSSGKDETVSCSLFSTGWEVFELQVCIGYRVLDACLLYICLCVCMCAYVPIDI